MLTISVSFESISLLTSLPETLRAERMSAKSFTVSDTTATLPLLVRYAARADLLCDPPPQPASERARAESRIDLNMRAVASFAPGPLSTARPQVTALRLG